MVIGTTAEHPFNAQGRGWVDAGDLEVGDWLLTATGRWLMVEEVHDTGEVQTVYNFEVADHHTYFVGTPDWPALVWVHNYKSSTSGNNAAAVRGKAKHSTLSQELSRRGHSGQTTLPSRKRVDGLKVSHKNKTVVVLELKPNNDRAKALGKKQLTAYAAEVQTLYPGYTIKEALLVY